MPAPEAPTPESDRTPQPYKATVLLFMQGGADTFNVLVPIDCSLYDEYKVVRHGLAHEQSTLLPIKDRREGHKCRRFGIHPNLKFLGDLYERRKQAAFLSNVGSLLKPIDREGLRNGDTERCRGLYSHSHQKAAAHNLQCQSPRTAPRGVGGNMADELGERGFKTSSFSVDGRASWSQGLNTKAEIIDKGRGAVRYNQYELWGRTINNVSNQSYGNLYCEEYSQLLASAMNSSEELGKVLDHLQLETEYNTDSNLAKQLHQVARLIKAREEREAERDFFFVQIGGFDQHNDFTQLDDRLLEIDEALKGFVEELDAQKVFDSVTLITASDFGRTLTFNGRGTDHGWGGNYFVLGGGIHGGRIFNDFPSSFLPGHDYDAGRGRVIPKYPWESVMVPIAEWMGVKDMTNIFPNLGNFNRSEHIISRTDLFHSE